jgi:hypothetical protein
MELCPNVTKSTANLHAKTTVPDVSEHGRYLAFSERRGAPFLPRSSLRYRRLIKEFSLCAKFYGFEELEFGVALLLEPLL